MSYPIDMDEQPVEVLVDEILRRVAVREHVVTSSCDYCGYTSGTGGSCKLPSRHADVRSGPDFLRWVVEALTQGRCRACLERKPARGSCHCEDDE